MNGIKNDGRENRGCEAEFCENPREEEGSRLPQPMSLPNLSASARQERRLSGKPQHRAVDVIRVLPGGQHRRLRGPIAREAEDIGVDPDCIGPFRQRVSEIIGEAGRASRPETRFVEEQTIGGSDVPGVQHLEVSGNATIVIGVDAQVMSVIQKGLQASDFEACHAAMKECAERSHRRFLFKLSQGSDSRLGRDNMGG